MAFNTYTDLQTSVANWLHRSDLSALIPDFITLAERKISNNIRSRSLEIAVSQVMIKDSNGVYCITLPSDYSSLKNISISGSINTVLTLIPDDSLLNYNSFNTTGNPLFYSIQNNTVYFSPAPSSAFTVNFVYYQDVPPLATNNTNWLLTQYPMVYLYGALIEGCTYIQDFEQQQLYQARFDDAIEDIWQNYAMESFSGSPLRSISDYTV